MFFRPPREEVEARVGGADSCGQHGAGGSVPERASCGHCGRTRIAGPPHACISRALTHEQVTLDRHVEAALLLAGIATLGRQTCWRPSIIAPRSLLWLLSRSGTVSLVQVLVDRLLSGRLHLEYGRLVQYHFRLTSRPSRPLCRASLTLWCGSPWCMHARLLWRIVALAKQHSAVACGGRSTARYLSLRVKGLPSERVVRRRSVHASALPHVKEWETLRDSAC